MVLNRELQHAVRHFYAEIVQGFKTEGVDFSSSGFLSKFPYAFIKHDKSDRGERVLAAALSKAFRSEAERAVEAFYWDSSGGTTELYVCDAVEDFPNYAIPRAVGLPDEMAILDELYAQFDQSLFGESYALLGNWLELYPH
jgi:hypothetical protein